MIRPVPPIHPAPHTAEKAHRGTDAVAAGETDERSATARALTVISPGADREQRERSTLRPLRRPDAAFIAHMIAIEAGDPQTRTRRMAAPEASAARYAESMLRPAATRTRADSGIVL